MKNIIQGDLIQLAIAGHFDVIIHGCNCFCTMGAGIAKLIKDRFPQAYQADLKTKKADRQKLGSYSCARVEKNSNHFFIVNGYTQYEFSGSDVLVDYQAVKNLFSRIKKDFANQRIGYPKIGAGLAKGDWEKISDIIETQLKGENHTLVEYAP